MSHTVSDLVKSFVALKAGTGQERLYSQVAGSSRSTVLSILKPTLTQCPMNFP
jgi:hypothetical protein